ncbi:tape measure protein [Pasteurella multocida]|uniref:tape measure protein n=1 Tax=Pasteurella multocida TaxID=747 RepID=UPI0009994C66|nr:tape measure protein [Pasteurella multocida]OPD15003.1 phage tail protein [Pasteurella multocida subsp. septica]
MTDIATLAIEIRTNGISRANRDLRSVEQVSQKTEKAVNSLSLAVNTLKRLMALGIGIQGLSGFLQMADTMQSLRAQVKFVTGSLAELNKAQNELFNISQRTRSSLESTTQLYVRTSRALKDYGVSQQQALQFTETINKAMAVGGVGAQEQASALMQLSQALGSGRLQGDEFRTIAETAPIILDVVAEYMGKSRAEVKKLASEGLITSELLFKAISGSTEKINKQFEEMPLTFGQAMQQMQNAALKFVGDLNQSTNATNLLAQGVSFLAENFNTLGAIIGGVMLGHLAKYGQSMAMAAVNRYKQSLANLQVAKTEQVKAAAELNTARANMAVLASELKLAQTEQTRSVLRMRMAQQATLITSLTNAEAVATNNLATAQAKASIAGRALNGVMGLLGGPAGVITIAASALFYFHQKAEEAREKALDLAGANDRLKQSYEDLSEASLLGSIREQVKELNNSREQVKNVEAEIKNTQRVMNQFLGVAVPDELKSDLDALRDKLAQLREGEGINFQTLEKQLGVLAPMFARSGKNIDDFRKKLLLVGVSSQDAEIFIKSLEKSFTDSTKATEKAKNGYSRIESELAKLKEKTEEARQKFEILTLKQQGNEKASYVLSQLYDVLGEKGADYAKVLREIAVGNYIAAQSELSHIKDAKFSLEELIGMKKEAEAAFWFVSQTDKFSASGQDSLSEWKSFYNELQKASADSLTQISLNEEQALRDMLEKAKKAKIGHEEMERAKTLITEKYAKERMEVAENYVPSLRYERELTEHLKLIDQLQKTNRITAEQAGDAKLALSAKYNPLLAAQQTYINNLKEIELLEVKGGLTKPQADIARKQQATDLKNTEWQEWLKNADQSDPFNGLKVGIKEFGDQANDVMGNVGQITGRALNGMTDALTDFVMTGKANFADLARSIIADLARMIIKMMIFNALKSAFGGTSIGSFLGFESKAEGGIVGEHYNGGLVGFSRGGFTGFGGKYTPAGIVHRGEYVITKEATSRIGLDYLNYLNYGKRGFANGGGVDVPRLASPTSNSNRNISIKIINNGEPVQANVSSKESNGQLEVTVELIRQISKQVVNETIEDNFRQGGVFA